MSNLEIIARSISAVASLIALYIVIYDRRQRKQREAIAQRLERTDAS